MSHCHIYRYTIVIGLSLTKWENTENMPFLLTETRRSYLWNISESFILF